MKSTKKRLFLVLLSFILLLSAVVVPIHAEVEAAPIQLNNCPEQIWRESFDGVSKKTYTASELMSVLNWSNVYGEASGTTFEITEDGKLKISHPADASGDLDIYILQTDVKTVGSLVLDYDIMIAQTAGDDSALYAGMAMYFSSDGIGTSANNSMSSAYHANGQIRLRRNNYGDWYNNVAYYDKLIPYHKTSEGSHRGAFQHFQTIADGNNYEIYVNGHLTNTIQEPTKLNGYKQDFPYYEVGGIVGIKVAKGMEVTFDNLEVSYTGTQKPELLITEVALYGPHGWDSYVEVINNSDRVLNIYDYCIPVVNVEEGAFDTAKNYATNNYFYNVAYPYQGTHTFTATGLTITNPEDGSLYPGELATLFIPYNVSGDTSDLVGRFKSENQLPEGSKVFGMQNDSGTKYLNMSYDKSCRNRWFAVARKADYLNSNGTQKTVTNSFERFICYVMFNYDKVAYDNLKLNNDQVYCPWRDALPVPGDGKNLFAMNYTYHMLGDRIIGREGSKCLDNLDITKHDSGFSVGYQTDFSRGLSVAFSLNGTAMSGNSGNKIANYLPAGEQFLFAKSGDGYITSSAKGITAGMELYTLKLETLTGASIRINQPTGLRWQTRLDRVGFDTLENLDGVTDVQIGTLIARTEDIATAGGFTKAALVAAGKALVEVPATPHEWFPLRENEADYEFSGSVVKLSKRNYGTAFSGIGYVTFTLADGTTHTVYADYAVKDHSRTVLYVAACALADSQSGLSDADRLALEAYFPAPAQGTAGGVVPGENNAFTARYSGVNVQGYTDYCAKLEANGYSKQSTGGLVIYTSESGKLILSYAADNQELNIAFAPLNAPPLLQD